MFWPPVLHWEPELTGSCCLSGPAAGFGIDPECDFSLDLAGGVQAEAALLGFGPVWPPQGTCTSWSRGRTDGLLEVAAMDCRPAVHGGRYRAWGLRHAAARSPEPLGDIIADRVCPRCHP